MVCIDNLTKRLSFDDLIQFYSIKKFSNFSLDYTSSTSSSYSFSFEFLFHPKNEPLKETKVFVIAKAGIIFPTYNFFIKDPSDKSILINVNQLLFSIFDHPKHNMYEQSLFCRVNPDNPKSLLETNFQLFITFSLLSHIASYFSLNTEILSIKKSIKKDEIYSSSYRFFNVPFSCNFIYHFEVHPEVFFYEDNNNFPIFLKTFHPLNKENISYNQFFSKEKDFLLYSDFIESVRKTQDSGLLNDFFIFSYFLPFFKKYSLSNSYRLNRLYGEVEDTLEFPIETYDFLHKNVDYTTLINVYTKFIH